MSRSKKHTPVCGMTSARSEKQDKRLFNRRYRSVCKQLVHADHTRGPLPRLREYSNLWAMSKDGKMRFDPEDRPQLMRK